uniref:Reverse transcriptase domain-containing protein n=1 Tax=Tanacetum cinerariifolium TaxID=118510 RepID=A0A6L2L3G5_TANCI|nr:hypothetical protein [Tanacetum cinerariifolium]
MHKEKCFSMDCGSWSCIQKIKKLIAELPTLTAPMEKEELIVYLMTAQEVVNAVLMTEKEAKKMPVYFVSRALQGPEINYTSMENFGTSFSACKQTAKEILPGTSDYYHHGPANQADFIVERLKEDSLVTTMVVEEELPEPWTLFMNGSSCMDGSGASMILTIPEGTKFTYVLRFRFDATNNEAEALIADLRIAEQMGIKNLQTNVDSCLVVPRSENKKADALRKIASTSFAHLTKQVLVEEVSEKSINEVKVLAAVEEEGDTWMNPIYNYLTEETLPAEKEKAKAIRRKSGRYAVINGVLYKKSYLGPWLRYVGPLQANYVLREIHEGSCSMHARTRSVVAKAIRIGYYWPTMHADARKLIRKCQDCRGIDIAGPFPEGPGKVKLIIVGMDYFTKWIESKPVATITVIPVEICMPTLRTSKVDMVQDDEALEINFDLLEEIREQAAIHEAKSKAEMEKYYNSKVHNTTLNLETWYTGSTMPAMQKDSEKLSPK